MNTSEKRSNPRKKVCVQAFASDVRDSFDVKCIIRDMSKGGCMIVTTNINELPELIQIIPEGFDKPLTGKIVWRGQKFAGVSFIAANDKDLVQEVQQHFVNMIDANEVGVLDLAGFVRPLGYADRLARYRSKSK